MAYPALFIKKDNKYQKVAAQDILFLNAAGPHLHLITLTGDFSVAQNLSQFMRKNVLPTLVRVHRSYLVNVQNIDSFDHAYVYIGDHKIPIGESYRQGLMKGLRKI